MSRSESPTNRRAIVVEYLVLVRKHWRSAAYGSSNPVSGGLGTVSTNVKSFACVFPGPG